MFARWWRPVEQCARSLSTLTTTSTVRSGIIAQKKGMTAMWDEWGVRMPVTVLQLSDVQVTGIKTQEKHGYSALQVGATKAKKVTKPLAMHYAKLGVTPKRHVCEFRVTQDAVLPIGHSFNAAHFAVGRYVDVSAPSIGKGFQGVMKRWNFKGLPASHGVSLAHRSGGSTGQRKWPSKVFKGKKMAGRMGGQNVTVQNLKVLKVDTALNLLYVKGSVPGYDDQYVHVKDAVKRKTEGPVPTVSAEVLASMPREMVALSGGEDPMVMKE